MFKDYFGIEENPFSNTPDPNYLFMSEHHQEALAHLQYGIFGSSGFVLLTGEVGTGKTTICRYLLEHLPPNIDFALCLNPRLSEAELLAVICTELGIDVSGCSPTSIKDHMDVLNRHLLVCYAKGRRAVLIIDEAQSLGFSLLEQIRLLTNLETASTKLLQVILIGQPELRGILDQENMRQLNQRITARYHLEPMAPPEAVEYIRHRLRTGGLDEDLIEPAAMDEIVARSGGIPRLINSICERCLLGAYAEEKKRIDGNLARRAGDEVLGPALKPEEETDGPRDGPREAPGETPGETPGDAPAPKTGPAAPVAGPAAGPDLPEMPFTPPGKTPGERESGASRKVLVAALLAAFVMGTVALSKMDRIETAMASSSAGPGTGNREPAAAPDRQAPVPKPGPMPGPMPGPTGKSAPEKAARAAPAPAVPSPEKTVMAEPAPPPEAKVPEPAKKIPVSTSDSTSDSTSPADEAAEAISRLIASGAVTARKTAADRTEVASRPDAGGLPVDETAVRDKAAFPAGAPETGEPDAAGPAGRELTLATLFRHPGIQGGLDTAVTRLFSLWNRKPKTLGGLNPCADAEKVGLKCYHRRGTWAGLEKINLPALIGLVGSDGARRYGVVSALTGNKATLDIDGRKIDADIEDLKPFWSGTFLVLWEPLPNLRINLRAGMSGKDVVWLRDRLGRILGVPSGQEDQDFFDATLKKKIIAFQQSHRLKGDGIVGMMTQIQISAALNKTSLPFLRNHP